MESIAAVMGVVPANASEEREVQSQTSESGALKETTEQDIAKLAYALWEERGRPLESAQEDWIRAEEFMSRHMVRTASVHGLAGQNWSEAEDQLRRQKIRAAGVGG